jgi:hypothetical protein
MGWRDIFRRTSERLPTDGAPGGAVVVASASVTAGPRRSLQPEERWYVPVDGNRARFVDPDGGMPLLHLIRYRSGGESVLRLCEDSTGLLVGPTDRRLAPAGIYVSNLRGLSYHKTACRRGDFSPGTVVRLKREPANKSDPFAVAVTEDSDGAPVAAYVNKQKARTLSKLLDSGADLVAVSLRGSTSGIADEQISILVAAPAVVAHLLSPRPRHLPRPAHQR